MKMTVKLLQLFNISAQLLAILIIPKLNHPIKFRVWVGGRVGIKSGIYCILGLLT